MSSLPTRAVTADAVPARERLYAAPGREPAVPLFTLACAVVLGLGFWIREERLFVPDRGAGYALGILGLAATLLLLLYPLRKRLRRAARLGALRHWFRAHMLLGVLAPAAILLHANYQVRSVNSAIALASMLVVVASGFAGRFLYARIHRGLFGRRRELRELQAAGEARFGSLRGALRPAPEVAALLEGFAGEALAPAGGLRSAWRLLAMRLRVRSVRRASLRALRRAGAPDAAGTGRALRAYLRAALRVAEFRFCERLFSLWHAVHLPLCVLLLGAAAAHVVAVHMF